MSENASEMLTASNPANKDIEPKGNRRARVPMSVPMRRLEVPELPGYHQHFIKESNVPRALAAYYEFVDQDEHPGFMLNQRNPGISMDLSGSTDLGNRISFVAGIGGDGKPERLFLMKLKEEYWLEDRAKIDARHAGMLGGIFRGETILGSEKDKDRDKDMRYVDMERTKALFARGRRTAKPGT